MELFIGIFLDMHVSFLFYCVCSHCSRIESSFVTFSDLHQEYSPYSDNGRGNRAMFGDTFSTPWLDFEVLQLVAVPEGLTSVLVMFIKTYRSVGISF